MCYSFFDNKSLADTGILPSLVIPCKIYHTLNENIVQAFNVELWVYKSNWSFQLALYFVDNSKGCFIFLSSNYVHTNRDKMVTNNNNWGWFNLLTL